MKWKLNVARIQLGITISFIHFTGEHIYSSQVKAKWIIPFISKALRYTPRFNFIDLKPLSILVSCMVVFTYKIPDPLA